MFFPFGYEEKEIHKKYTFYHNVVVCRECRNVPFAS